MKIVVDENMPKIEQLFNGIAQIQYVNGRQLTKEQLLDADALLVRSVTKVNEHLLDGTPVKFVGTATIGIDHIDTEYLKQKGIGFANAPGCNADAVADYVFSALSYLYEQKGVAWLSLSIGVVGYGNVGRKVYQRLSTLGCQLKVYDPFKEQSASKEQGLAIEQPVHFSTLEDVVASDIVILHAPLTKGGEYPTFSMLDDEVLQYLRAGSAIISAGRGGVINEQALLKRYNQVDGNLSIVFDVWNDEPEIDMAVMDLVDIATPHIAGYSLQGRERGAFMVFQSFCQFFGIESHTKEDEILSKGIVEQLFLADGLCGDRVVDKEKGAAGDTLHLKIARACHAIYNLSRDDAMMRKKLRTSNNAKQEFDLLRKNYVERDEFSTCRVITENAQLFKSIGFSKK